MSGLLNSGKIYIPVTEGGGRGGANKYAKIPVLAFSRIIEKFKSFKGGFS